MGEGERCDQHGQDPRVEGREGSDRDAEAGEHELDREPGRREEAALADAVAASEAQHRGQQRMVDDDERDCRRDPRSCEAEVAAAPDGLDGEPGGQGAQRVVGEVEELDVPGVAAAHELRDVQGGDEAEQQQRVEYERARDDEGGPRVKAVVAADSDAEERRYGRERQQQQEGGPVVAVRTVVGERRGGRDERREADRGDVERGGLGQAAHAPGLPTGSFCDCWDAAHLRHLVKVGDKPRLSRRPRDNRQQIVAAAPQPRHRRLRRFGERGSPVRGIG